MTHKARQATSEVFGMSNEVLPDSYVDRGDLDEEVRRLLGRRTHIALRGASKCGKSWLRQKSLPDAIVVQCRLGKTCLDLYRDALGALGVRLETQASSGRSLTGRVEAQGEVGLSLFAKLGFKAATEALESGSQTTVPVGQDISDLRFIADLVRASGRRLVVEDFHYLSVDERRLFAFDLKTLWDYGIFLVIVGVWSEQNMLLYLNPDLAGRVRELSIVWGDRDLRRIFEKGGDALNITFAEDVQAQAVRDCFENAGVLQVLILGMLDELGIDEAAPSRIIVHDTEALTASAMAYAEQLNPLYQQFAQRVSKGIRNRADATGIYAHAMAAVLAEPDEQLLRGVHISEIFKVANERQPRIQRGNLKTVLEKFEGLQVDEDGRGLVLAYNEATEEVSVVDRQLLLYRKYSTVQWPWEELIREAEQESGRA